MKKTILISFLALLLSPHLKSQCTISVPSSRGYTAIITLKPKNLVTPATCTWGYNYNVAIEYSISFTGRNIPRSLNTLQGNLGCGKSIHFFDLPEIASSGTVVSQSNVWRSLTDCTTATVNSLECKSFALEIQGPGISNQIIKCEINLCNAGTAAPNLNALTQMNRCPATTADLTAITASNTPAGTVLEWHTGLPITAANKVNTTNAVTGGTYYAVFYDAINNCYSPASSPVSVTITRCCSAGVTPPAISSDIITNICPLTTIDLTSITVSNVPVGAVLEWHTSINISPATKVAVPSAVSGGTYYATFFDTFNNCYSPYSAVFADVIRCCSSGTAEPYLDESVIMNICPATTADISVLTATNQPSGAVLEFHNAEPVSATTLVNNLSSVGAGVYYVVFHDLINNCYSNLNKIQVVINECNENGITSGNDGGLESDGCLANAIAQRNYNRIKGPSVSATGTPISYDNPKDLQMFVAPKSSGLQTRGDKELESFIPQQPFIVATTPYITTPTDLLTITNAKKVLSVDYFENTSKRRLAAVLTTKTEEKVYDHTKVICDRLVGSELLSTEKVMIDGKSFILSVLRREDGVTEYNINFSVNQEDATTVSVASQWALDAYLLKPDYWNYQIWAETPYLAKKLALGILNKFKEQFNTLNSTAEPAIPEVFVKKGQYDNGVLTLHIQNSIGANQITLSGNFTTSETHKREAMNKTIALSGKKEETVEIYVGSIFDIGFAMKNNKTAEYDALYFADGAWGLEYNKNASTVSSYEVNNTIPNPQSGVYSVERSPILRGVVKDYVSLFRSLRPASVAADMSSYKNVTFTASGTHVVDVILVKKSITDWSKQYRTEVRLFSDKQTYVLPLNEFSNGTTETLKADDIVDVVFTIKGDGKTDKPFEMSLENLAFNSKSFERTSVLKGTMQAFPNPATEITELIFDMPERIMAQISLADFNGRQLIVRNEELAKGRNRIALNVYDLPRGVYVASIITVQGKISAKVIVP